MEDADRPRVEAYLSSMSALPGEALTLHASSKLKSRLMLKMFREEAAAQEPLVELVLEDPGMKTCTQGMDTHGCGWPVSVDFIVPEDAASGVYRLELSLLEDDAEATYDELRGCLYKVLLVVRAPVPRSGVLLVLSTNTYLAYNNWVRACACCCSAVR